jgi:hypothetical protein
VGAEPRRFSNLFWTGLMPELILGAVNLRERGGSLSCLRGTEDGP